MRCQKKRQIQTPIMPIRGNPRLLSAYICANRVTTQPHKAQNSLITDKEKPPGLTPGAVV